MTTNPCDIEQLQAYLHGECRPAQEEALASHLASCRRCQEDLQMLQEQEEWVNSSLALLQEAPQPDPMASFAHFARAHQERIEALDAPRTTSLWERASWLFQSLQWGSAVAACALFVWMLPSSQDPGTPLLPSRRQLPYKHQAPNKPKQAKPNHLLAKGFPLQMFYAANHFPMVFAAKPIAEGQVVHPSDLIQFHYQTRQSAHIMVVGLSDQKAIFSYVPLNGKRSQPVQAGVGRLPEKALALDETLGAEKFYLIVSHKPFTFEEVRKMLLEGWSETKGKLRSLHLGRKGWQVKSFLVHKQIRAKRP